MGDPTSFTTRRVSLPRFMRGALLDLRAEQARVETEAVELERRAGQLRADFDARLAERVGDACLDLGVPRGIRATIEDDGQGRPVAAVWREPAPTPPPTPPTADAPSPTASEAPT
jgi:hypothetical protein